MVGGSDVAPGRSAPNRLGFLASPSRVRQVGHHHIRLKALSGPLLSRSSQRDSRPTYCSNDLAFGLHIRPRSQALRSSYIQLNAPSDFCFLPFDIDRAQAAFAWDEANLPAPNIIVANPGNGHAHLIYMLADPVHALAQSRSKPLRYLADIERGMIRRMEADPRYSGLIAKNDSASRWRTRWLALFLTVWCSSTLPSPAPTNAASCSGNMRSAWAATAPCSTSCARSPTAKCWPASEQNMSAVQFRTRIEHIAAKLTSSSRLPPRARWSFRGAQHRPLGQPLLLA